MVVIKEKIMDTFEKYTDKYDSKDPKIKLKIDHTYRVANLCERIAKNEGLDEDDCMLAWAIGMLHDIGRFEQIKRYGTFNDSLSVDHANFGADLLFVDGLIKDYFEELNCENASENTSNITKDKDFEVLETAIRNHSAYVIEAGLDERTMIFSNIIRDADKIDILRVNIDTPLEDIYNVTTEELLNSEVSESVMENFNEHRAILRSNKKTAIDNLVGHIALTFELVFPISYDIVMEQGYLAKMLEFRSKNPKTVEQFKHIKNEILTMK